MKKHNKFYIFALILIAIFSSCVSSSQTKNNAKKNSENTNQMKNDSAATHDTDFFVSSFSPNGVIPAAVNYPSIQIQFSEPVVPLAKLGEPLKKISGIEISPSLKGVFRWYGTGLLSFDCEEALIPQKFYTLKISEKLESIHGNKISGQTEFSFHTEEIRMTSVEPGYTSRTEKKLSFNSNDIPPEYATDIAITFSNNVNAKVISEFISVRENKKDGKEFKFTAKQISDTEKKQLVSNQTKRILLKLNEKFPHNTEIIITLKEGAVPDKNCYATNEEQTRTFHTLKPIEFNGADGTSTLHISFNHRITEKSLEKIKDAIKFNIKGNSNFQVTDENISVQYNSIVVKDIPVTYGSSYSFTLDANCVEDVYGQLYKKQISQTIEVPDADSYANFRNSDFQILESQFLPRLAFEHQNILKDSTYTITPLSGVTENFKLPNAIKFEMPSTEKKDSENKNRRVIESVDLSSVLEKTSSGQFRGALKFDANIKTEFINWRKGKETTETATKQFIQVTDLGVTTRTSYNKIVALVTSLSDGTPIENASISIVRQNESTENQWDFYESLLSGKTSKITTATTDKDGLAVIDLKNVDEAEQLSQNFWLEVKTKDDRVIVSTQKYYSYYKPMYISKNASATASASEKSEYANVPKRAVTFMYSDRGLYRPGETATIKVIDRELTAGNYSTYTGDYEISFSSFYGSRTIYKTEKGTVTSNGTAHAEWKLPEDLKPGNYLVTYTRKDGTNETRSISINVQFFERLRFQATATIPEIVYFRGDTVSAEINATYLGGGALAGGTATSDWNREAIYFAPTGKEYEDMTFGPATGWRYYYEDQIYEPEDFYVHEETTLSNEGKARFSVASGSEKKAGSAYQYFLEAQVTDAGNQMIAARAKTIVHPAAFYIGVSSPLNVKGFARKGESLDFNVAVATPEGNYPEKSSFLKDSKISYELSREVWEEIESTDDFGNIQHEWKRKNITEATGNINIPTAPNNDIINYTKFSVKPENGGSYTLTLRTKDFLGREIVTEKIFYVSGSDIMPYYPYRDSNSINLTPDKELYDAGEVAHILLESPLEKGKYLLTLEREGIISEKIITLKTASSTIDVPIEENFVPIVYVAISSYSERSGETASDYDTADNNKPKAFYGITQLRISNATRSFEIKVETDKNSYTPGSEAKIDLTAMKNGKPVKNAELTLMAVDRGVVDLIDYHVQNPLEYFYSEGHFPHSVSNNDSRNRLVDPVTFGTYSVSAKERRLFYETRMFKSAAMSNGVMEEAAMDSMLEAPTAAARGIDDSDTEAERLQVRKNFNATAIFITLITDENGKASTTFKLPDNLTEYRITVAGVSQNNFSLAEETLVAANPISVRDVEPRILRPGDEGEAGVVITNIGDTTENVTVKFDLYSGLELTDYKHSDGELLRTNGNAEIIGRAEKTVAVKAGETTTLMFGIRAINEGWITVAFTAKTSGGKSAGAAALNEIIYKPLEIEKPYVYESVTTVGEIPSDQNKKEERIILPSGIDDNKGSLFVQLDATRLGTLTSAVDYVFHYPYGCLEQRSSAIMPLISFADYIDVFSLNSEVENPHEVVAKEIESWASIQKKDGGFPYWRDSNYSSFAVSLRIAEIITLAKEHGVKISDKIDTEKLASFIERETAEIEKSENNYYPLAYSYYVLAKLGRKVSAKNLKKIISANDAGISEYAFAGLAALQINEKQLAENAAVQLKNRMALTPRGISFQTGTPHWAWYYYNTNAERYALSLSLLTQLDANDVYVSHIVYELLEMQKTGKGKWQSTATTSRVLMAIETYIKTHALDKTNFTANALLDGKKFAEGKFEGANAKPVSQLKEFDSDALANVEREKELPLIFTKDGDGTLFYTISMKYALPADEQKARDEGICVYTEITDARTGALVTSDKLESGKIYKQKIFVSTPKERTFVALRVPVPAGAEILNSAFTTTASVPQHGTSENGVLSGSRKIGIASRKMILPPMYSISHQDIYDAEVQCFWDYLPQGMQQIEFMFRPVRNGNYSVPSIQAECMYEPEIFGRTDGKIWTIE